ncbi:hypothetical protein Hanom_Chr09g00844881 [Helianthus anomalus]
MISITYLGCILATDYQKKSYGFYIKTTSFENTNRTLMDLDKTKNCVCVCVCGGGGGGGGSPVHLGYDSQFVYRFVVNSWRIGYSLSAHYL